MADAAPPPPPRVAVTPAEEDDDRHLDLPPEQILILKKTLYHFSRTFTTMKDHDVFLVSWDVMDLPQPPEEVSAVLPPASWDEPDIIVFGLQNVHPGSEDEWAMVLESSVKDYSFEFLPLAEDEFKGSTSVGGLLTLLFCRESIRRYFHGCCRYDVEGSVWGSSLRFTLHQTPVAVLSAVFHRPRVDEGPKSHLEMHEVLAKQQFYTLEDRIKFDVEGFNLKLSEDHPIIIFVGCRDLQPTLGSAAKNFPVLRRLKTLDLRVDPKAAVGAARRFRGDCKVLKAGVMRLMMEASGRADQPLPARESAPEVCLVRMSLPTADPDRLKDLYHNVYRALKSGTKEGASVDLDPPLVTHESPIPSHRSEVFKVKLRNSNRYPAAFSVLCLSDSGRQIVPVSKHSYLHLAKTGTSTTTRPPGILTPRTGHQREDSTRRSSQLSGGSASVRSGGGAAPSWSRKFAKLKKKGQKMLKHGKGKGNKDAHAEPNKEESVHSADSTDDASTVLKSASTFTVDAHTLDSEAPIAQSEISVAQCETPAVPRLELPHSRSIPEKKERLTKHAQGSDIDASKWILIEPEQGVVLGGNEVEVSVTLDIREGILRNQDVDSLLLAFRVDDSKFDKFFCISCALRPSVFGMTLNQLQAYKFKTIRHDTSIPSILLPGETPDVVVRSRKDGRVKYVKRGGMGEGSDDHAESGESENPGTPETAKVEASRTGDACESALRSQSALESESAVGSGGGAITLVQRTPDELEGLIEKHEHLQRSLPLPKEIWWLIEHVYANQPNALPRYTDAKVRELSGVSNLLDKRKSERRCHFDLPGFLGLPSREETLDAAFREQMTKLVEAIETGSQIPEGITPDAALKVLEKWALTIPVPLIPREFVAEFVEDEMHMMCRAVTLSLPITSRNVVFCIMALLKSLLKDHIDHNFDAERGDVDIDVGTPSTEETRSSEIRTTPEIAAIHKALIEWASRFLLRDTPPGIAHPFLRHFISIDE